LLNVESKLKAKFPIKEAPANQWLGMKIVRNSETNSITITQEKFITNLLEQFNMTDCKPTSPPVAPGTKLNKSQEGEIDHEALNFPYREAVGSLLWLARTSRPDILYAVIEVSKFCANPNLVHVTAVKRILRYLKGTKSLGITLHQGNGSDLSFKVYVDADHAGEPEVNDGAMKSVSGIIAYIPSVGPFYSETSLQPTISKSTFESEYKATGKAGQIAVGFRQLLNEIGFNLGTPTTIYNDNNACVVSLRNKLSGSSTRHIKIQFHYIKELIADKEVIVEYCPTERMVADILTKALPRVKFEYLRHFLLNGMNVDHNLG
jgi:hypothetical protein